MRKLALFCVSVAVAFSLNACNAMLARISGKDGSWNSSSRGSNSGDFGSWNSSGGDFGANLGDFGSNSGNFSSATHSQKSIINELSRVQKKWQNTPYKLGGASVSGSDCSGFIQSVFKEHFKATVPRTTVTQFQSGVSVKRNALKAGDIVFFRTGRGPNGLHTGIYVDNDEFIHLSTKGGVKKVSLNSSYWKPKFIGARRYLR